MTMQNNPAIVYMHAWEGGLYETNYYSGQIHLLDAGCQPECIPLQVSCMVLCTSLELASSSPVWYHQVPCDYNRYPNVSPNQAHLAKQSRGLCADLLMLLH